jgi:broad specificity phosphatase PhoE
MTTTALPQVLWIVRHGQSAGNVASDAAEAQGLQSIDIATRDIDVPLSDLGRRQAQSLGRWFGKMEARDRPEVVLCSPYIRAHDTALRLLEAGKMTADVKLRLDERLREKEFGILDRLTHFGIGQQYPELDEERRHVGKFYFRPPGGESWCDVILRLRTLLEMVTREYAGQRVLVIAHQVIVNCTRYLVERLDEKQILKIDRQGGVPNCGVTAYKACGSHPGDRTLNLDVVNFVAPLEQENIPVTRASDLPAAPEP